MNTCRLQTTKYCTFYKAMAILMVVVFIIGNIGPGAPNVARAETTAAQPSHNVAYIDSLTVVNGGTFPTTTTGPTGSFLDYHFYRLPYTSVSLANLLPGGICGAEGCDTVLLNVASSGLYCNLGRLTAQQKTDLVSFVDMGRKLIIYDSECVSQDYSWLPAPFTTQNPGALGATGTLNIVEENTLSSTDPTSPYYINAPLLASGTDAVGDMNVMITYDSHWYLDMSGTNVLGYTGPVHTYNFRPLNSDVGLIIYNGLDVDYLTSTTIPEATTARGNLAKIWLQELQQLFNPSELPGTSTVVGITLLPDSATLNIGQVHTVTATLSNLIGEVQVGIPVAFSIQSGPNAGALGSCNPADCISDANGEVTFSYMGSGGAGTDVIVGCFYNADNVEVCDDATAIWEQQTVPEIDYFALGDSIASGHGLTDDGTDCHRSYISAYPWKVYDSLTMVHDLVYFPPTYFRACSGATALYNSSQNPDKWLNNQVNFVIDNLSDRKALVSISIGMNDFGWADPKVLLAHIMQGRVKYTQWLEEVADAVSAELVFQGRRILTQPHDVVIVFNEYHNPINLASIFFYLTNRACDDLLGTLECYERTELLIHTLNAHLTLDVMLPLSQEFPGRVGIAQIHQTFHGHESPQYVCGTHSPGIEDTWIQYPGDPNSNARVIGWLHELTGFPYGDCFHPNNDGANAYASEVFLVAEVLLNR